MRINPPDLHLPILFLLPEKIAKTTIFGGILDPIFLDALVKSLLERHPGESRGPEHLEITGFRLSPE